MASWNEWFKLTGSPHRELDLAVSPSLLILMASSEVDQKYLGRFANMTGSTHAYLSGMLFKVLGLSVRLSRKLVRARRHRKLDTTRDTKSLQLYHHIIWLSREGLVIIEQYVIPMTAATSYNELKVLSYKLRASFYHIYVLFYNSPPITQASNYANATAQRVAANAGGNKGEDKTQATGTKPSRQNGTTGEAPPVDRPEPPGLGRIALPDPYNGFLIPSRDYVPQATTCFQEAVKLSDDLLYGSHPIRLSIKLEYAAYTYDCIKDADQSRNISKRAITDVLNAQEPMDDEMFDDSAELVKILGKMMKRGLGNTPGSTPGAGSSSTPGSKTAAGSKTTPKKSVEPAPPLPSPVRDDLSLTSSASASGTRSTPPSQSTIKGNNRPKQAVPLPGVTDSAPSASTPHAKATRDSRSTTQTRNTAKNAYASPRVGNSTTSSSTPRSRGTPGSSSTIKAGSRPKPAAPPPGMTNPI